MKFLKKSMAVLLCVAMLVTQSAIVFAAESTGNFSIVVSAETVDIGDTVTVVVSSANMQVAMLGCMIKFDTDYFECTNITGEGYEEYGEFSINSDGRYGTDAITDISTLTQANSTGSVSFGINNSTDAVYYATDDIATYTFKALQAGDTSIYIHEECSGTDESIGDTQTEYITITDPDAPASTYDVTYKSEDGNTTIYTESVEEGSYPVYATAPTKADSADGSTSYSFLGWSTVQDSANDIVTLSDITEATTLYAIFEDSTNTYTVTFDPQNDDATTPVVTTVGTDVTPITSPTKADTTTESYTFAGWSTTANGDVITDWSSVTSGTVYAIYTATAKTYTVTFMNGTTTVETSSATNVGTAVTLPANPTKEGDYTFSHWSTTENGVAVTWTDLTAGAHTVYAVYTSAGSGNVNQAYTITTTLDKDEYRSGDTVTATVTASSATATNIAGFEMTAGYDSNKVTFNSITAGSSFSAMSTGEGTKATTVFYTAPNGTGVALAADTAVELFTVTYTVPEDVSGEDVEFTVTDLLISPSGYNDNEGVHTITKDTADIIDTVDITLTAGENGAIGATTEFTLDSGDTLADLEAATGYVAPTANENYVFSGWAVSGSTDNILADTYAFDDDTELVAVFVPDSFAISVAGDATDNATVSYQTGVTNDEATYNTDVTFTVAADSNYIVSDVAYSVDGGTNGTLTAANGVYTINGENITGEVTITVSAVAYYEITFSAGTGSTLTETTLYTKAGNSGLYASVDALKAGETTASVPTPTASTGYRLAADTAAEPLWTDSTDNVTTAWFATATFSANASYTVNTVKTWNISFAAGDNGSVTDVTGSPFDDQASITVPVPVANSGYVFDSWSSSTSTTLAKDATTLTATEDATYTATFTEGTYDVTYPTQDWLDITGSETATYNTDLTFTLAVDSAYTDDYTINTVTYTIGEGNAVTLVAESDGSYKVPGSVITDDVAIGITSTNTFTVTFKSDENGSLTGTLSEVVDENGTVSAVPTTVGNTGYEFSHWTNSNGDTVTDPTTVAVIADETYTANFKQIQYTFSADISGVTIDFDSTYDSAGYATYGTDVTFTISSEAAIITGVSLNGTALVADEYGVYTIPGSIISGDTAALTLTVSTFDGTISFIDLEDSYMAKNSEAAGRRIMVLDAGDENDSTYKLADGTELYWSSEYSAYVAIVGDSETAQTLSVGMTSTSDATANTIDYSGDVNGDGSVNVIDAIIVNDILHGTRLTSTSDAYLFRADVDGSKVISATDITVIKNDVLGITND